MKKILFLFVAIAVLLVAGVVPVYAHGGGFHGTIWIGPGWGWGWGVPYPYYYPYYYYPQPPVVVQQQPPAYEYQEQAPQTQQYYWYFCPEANAYYPYVRQCPGGWKKVIPTPPKGGE